MANHNCHGDFFTLRGRRYYCCFWDSKIVTGANDGKQCPNCGRKVSAIERGECETVQVEYVVIPDRGQIEINHKML
jgi:hypothetical protein